MTYNIYLLKIYNIEKIKNMWIRLPLNLLKYEVVFDVQDKLVLRIKGRNKSIININYSKFSFENIKTKNQIGKLLLEGYNSVYKTIKEYENAWKCAGINKEVINN